MKNRLRKVPRIEVVLRLNVLSDFLVEELENQRDAVSEDQVLSQVLELVDMVQTEVLQKEQQN